MQSSTFWQEFQSAARGTWALLRGDRAAPQAYDYSQRGLVGSFIALIVAVTINAAVPSLGTVSASLAMTLATLGIVYVLQMGFSALALYQMQRMDGLVPYLVTDNWTTLLMVLATFALVFVGVPAGLVLLAAGIAGLIVKINIARLVVTLTPWQIAIFLIAQLVGGAVGLMIFSRMLPLPPEAALPA